MSEILTLKRNTHRSDCTLGQLFLNGRQVCLTLELPWADNQHDISCIPPGTYMCIPHNSPHHPNTWEITDVPNRFGILIHSASVPSELLGCVAVGSVYGSLNDEPAVLHSKDTMNLLREKLPRFFILTVIDA